MPRQPDEEEAFKKASETSPAETPDVEHVVTRREVASGVGEDVEREIPSHGHEREAVDSGE